MFPTLTVRFLIRKTITVRSAVVRLDNLRESGYYLRAMNKTGKLINILVLSIYLSSALLPLLYSTKSANADEDHAYPSHSTVLRSIIEQNLWLVPSDEQNADSSSAPDAHILLKKKRAIAPSFKEIVPRLFLHYANFPDFDPSLKISYVLMQIPSNALNCPNGFSYYHSGMSPPPSA